MENALTDLEKQKIREELVAFAHTLLGVEYRFGAEWQDFKIMPQDIDCSEMVEGVFNRKGLKMPDSSQAQFDFTVPTGNPKIGDLAFFGRGAKPNQIYHVGIVFDGDRVIEARAFDPKARFETGKVIFRPLQNWLNYKNFAGIRSHPKLA